MHAVKAGKVHSPAEKLFITEAVDSAGVVGAGAVGHTNPGTEIDPYSGASITSNAPPSAANGPYWNYDEAGETAGNAAFHNTRTTAWRHRGYGNVLFFDAHVESLRKDQFYSPDPTDSSKHVVNNRLWRIFK